MTDLNTDHLSQRERYLMSMVYSAFLGYTKDQDHAARQVNYIVKSADELEPATTPQPSASAMEPGALRALVTAANAVLAENPADDGMWTLEQAVRPFNATMPAECANGCPTNQVCDYCQYAPQPSADAVREDIESLRKRADGLDADSLEAESIGFRASAERMDIKSKLVRGIADELESLLGRDG